MDRLGRAQSGGDVPGQEFFDAIDRVLADVLDDVTKVGFGVEIVELRRADQAVDGGGTFSSGM